MKNKPVLELADVKAILNAAEAEASKNNWLVSIAVVDDGGNLLGMIRRDGAARKRQRLDAAAAHCLRQLQPGYLGP